MMGLLQIAVQTYDSHASLIGEYGTDKTPLAPIAHTVKKADIEITLTAEGLFYNASGDCAGEPVIIPVSVESAGRAGKVIAPHPLSDQLCYISPYFPEKYQAYLEQLTQWASSEYAHPKLKPILTYIQGGTILSDLEHIGVIKLTSKGGPEKEKQMVRWRVIGLEDGQRENCWEDKTLFSSYRRYYEQKQHDNALCMVMGKQLPLAKQHPKGIVSLMANAKLISANDKVGFTYRGRFSQETQAATVSYEASQKAHNALQWLVEQQGVRTVQGGRIFLCWNPNGQQIIGPVHPLLRSQAPIFRPSDYRDALKDALASRKNALSITEDVVLAAFDAATTGRLSLTYYSELQAHDFLQRLHDWDILCCWPHRNFGIQSPSLRQIVDRAFGTQRAEKGTVKLETDDRILRQQLQRLIACRVDRVALGTDVVKALVNRASTPTAYEDYIWEDILFAACAVIRKYRYDKFKEEWNMALEPERRDRSYQFGRLLAVMEKVERDTYDSKDGRQPNAMRLQSVFCQRPMYAAGQLEKQLERAYFPRLHPGRQIIYKNLMGQIMAIISSFPQQEWNRPLDNSYLMGYYLQRNALYTKNTENTEENNNEQTDE